MRSARLGELTWRDAERARDAGAAVLFPMGSTEEHGPHSPMGDYLAAEEIAVRAAEPGGDLVVPCLPYSYSEYFRDFPGTLSLSPTTLAAVVGEVVECLLDQGFRHVVLVNGHKGNEAALTHLVRDVRRQRGVLIPVTSPLGLGLTPAVRRELYGDAAIGHGAEPMGSLMKHLFPHLAQGDAVEDFGTGDFFGVPIASLASLRFEDAEVILPLNMSDAAPSSGSLADPRLASDERGRTIADTAVGKLTRFVAWWKTVDPRAPEAGGPHARAAAAAV
jgi:creatinine amidohydrolase